MKRTIKIFVCLLLVISIGFSDKISVCAKGIADSRENEACIKMIYDYEHTVNEKLREEYISLFDQETQNWMYAYSQEDFFIGEKIAIRRYKLLRKEVGVKAAFVSPDEVCGKDYCVFYVEAHCDTTEVKSENIKPLNGEISYVFLFVYEDNQWTIKRVSIADVSAIVMGNDGFETSQEKRAFEKERTALKAIRLYEPQTICIKMTKSANRQYWNQEYVTLDFKDYIRNVVPNEYYVSTGGEYLSAGTMAVKMFSWYHVLHKKYPFSPGGCDLQDSNADQVYVAGKYDSLADRDKRKMNTAMSNVSGKALVCGTSTIFETQYHKGQTNSTVGSLGTDTAAVLSNAGYSFLEILKDAYDYSDNAGGQSVKIIATQ